MEASDRESEENEPKQKTRKPKTPKKKSSKKSKQKGNTNNPETTKGDAPQTDTGVPSTEETVVTIQESVDLIGTAEAGEEIEEESLGASGEEFIANMF